MRSVVCIVVSRDIVALEFVTYTGFVKLCAVFILHCLPRTALCSSNELAAFCQHEG
jgi:hypothetical protein